MAKRKKPASDWRPVLSDLVAKPKRKSRAKYTPAKREAIKAFRSAVATLKKKGLVALGIDARKVAPTKALKKAIRENQGVLEGKETSYKISADIPKQMIDDLKSLGYRVKGRGKDKRIVVPKSQLYRQGNIFTRATTSRKSARVQAVKLTGDLDSQIRSVFDGLKPGDFAAFQVDGYNSYSVYASPDSMLRDLLSYQQANFRFQTLVTFKLTQSQVGPYLQDGRERVKAKRGGRKRMTAAKRAAVRSGMRVTRGH